jgi:methionyl-tRNA synthetase
MKTKKFYVTTPIYYPNDIPHVGHAYTTIVADVISRFYRLNGYDVFFLTGTDEHGKKIQEAAEKAGKKPKEFVDELIPKFKDAWKKLNINYDRFIRTTDKDHEKIVQEVLQKVYDKGDIYFGKYEGLYCVACERYYTEKELENGNCPIHKRPAILLKEDSYFFRLSKYQKKLLELYKKNPEFIFPESRRNEVISRVKEGLRDFSISRTSFDWGIKLPFDKKHVCYVWFDALLNYYSATKDNGYWPADAHLMAKDIVWFHAVYWPAMLMSARIKLPKRLLVHGYWTFDKEKISKSNGKIINVDELISLTKNPDSVRYFLLREMVFGEDGDFSEKALIERYNGELVNKLGNLVSRVSGLIEKEGLEKCENLLVKKMNIKKFNELIQNNEFDKGLNDVFAFIDRCNEYVQHKKPWETKNKKVLYELADSIRVIAILLWPFMPTTCEKIAKQFNFEINLRGLKTPLKISKIKKGEHLFSPIEYKENKENSERENKKDFQKNEDNEKINKQEIIHKIMEGIAEVDFSDWQKIDLRVAQIREVEDIPNADKLWKLKLDVGELGERTICAGIKQFYKKEELINKKIIYFTNLKPRILKGVESQGMLLAATNSDHTKVILISPIDNNAENGMKIS